MQIYDSIMIPANNLFVMAFLCLFILRRYSVKKSVLLCGLSVLLLLAAEAVKRFAYPESNVAYVIITVSQIVLVQGTALLISLTRDSRVLFTGMCASNYVLAGSLSGRIAYIFTDNGFLGLAVGIAVHALLLLLLIVKIRKIYLTFFEKTMNSWMGLCLIPALFYCSFCFLTFFPHSLDEIPYNIPGAILLLITMSVSYVVVFRYVYHEMNRSEINWQNHIFQSYIRGLEFQFDSVRKSEEKFKIIRHDMRHYAQLVHTLLKQEKYKEIEEMLNNAAEIIEDTKIVRYCENIQVNSILSNLVEKARLAGVTVCADVNIPEHIPVNGLELASVIANLLENAVDSVKEEEEKSVNLMACYSDRHLVIEVINRCVRPVLFHPLTGLPVTVKGEEHGFGLRSVKAFAEKTGAHFDCYCEKERFIVRILANF